MRADGGVEIAVFARAPIPGRTKTRLIGAIGAELAAALSEAFLIDTLGHLSDLDAPVSIWAASQEDATALSALAPEHEIHTQVEGDLAARLGAAFETILARRAAALIIGSDAPTLRAASYQRAVDGLSEGAELVIRPAADGGYTSIGATFVPDLHGVRWSSRHVLGDTLARVGDRPFRLLSPWYDVDTADDLRLLRAHLAIQPHAAPRTASLLRDLARDFDRGDAAE